MSILLVAANPNVVIMKVRWRYLSGWLLLLAGWWLAVAGDVESKNKGVTSAPIIDFSRHNINHLTHHFAHFLPIIDHRRTGPPDRTAPPRRWLDQQPSTLFCQLCHQALLLIFQGSTRRALGQLYLRVDDECKHQ